MRLYGKFQLEILNDKEQGEEKLTQSRNLITMKTDKKKMPYGGSDECSNDSTPTIILSTDQDKIGTITQINLTAASLFGYSKTELISMLRSLYLIYVKIDRKINILMPLLISEKHHRFLEKFIDNPGA